MSFIIFDIFKNIFGIWGEKFKRFFSFSPTVLAFEERREATKASRYMDISLHEWERISKYVKEHRVSPALKLFTRWIHHLRKAQENEIRLGMSQIFQDFHIIKVMHHLGEVLGKIVTHSKAKGGEFRKRVVSIVAEYVPLVIQDIAQAEKDDGADSQALMAIMNEAKTEQTTAKGILALRRLWKSRNLFSKLGRFAIRRDIRKELRNEKRLNQLAKRLEHVDKMISSKSAKQHEKALAEFGIIMAEEPEDMKEMFVEGHHVMKRDLLWIMMTLQSDEILELYGSQWIHDQFVPEMQVKAGIIKVEKLKEALFDKAHTMANGLGVVIKNLERIKHEFEADLQESRRD